jgi:uncharacterized protein YbjQ (UPF0145 family)
LSSDSGAYGYGNNYDYPGNQTASATANTLTGTGTGTGTSAAATVGGGPGPAMIDVGSSADDQQTVLLEAANKKLREELSYFRKMTIAEREAAVEAMAVQANRLHAQAEVSRKLWSSSHNQDKDDANAIPLDKLQESLVYQYGRVVLDITQKLQKGGSTDKQSGVRKGGANSSTISSIDYFASRSQIGADLGPLEGWTVPREVESYLSKMGLSDKDILADSTFIAARRGSVKANLEARTRSRRTALLAAAFLDPAIANAGNSKGRNSMSTLRSRLTSTGTSTQPFQGKWCKDPAVVEDLFTRLDEKMRYAGMQHRTAL